MKIYENTPCIKNENIDQVSKTTERISIPLVKEDNKTNVDKSR